MTLFPLLQVRDVGRSAIGHDLPLHQSDLRKRKYPTHDLALYKRVRHRSVRARIS